MSTKQVMLCYVTDMPALTTRLWFKYDFEQKQHTSQVLPDLGSNPWSPAHNSAVHVTEKPALTTRPSVNSSSFGSSMT